jgi:hypothetical protein
LKKLALRCEEGGKYNQKFKMLEIASMLFRSVKNSAPLNLLAEKFYSALQENGIKHSVDFYIYIFY